MQKRCFLVVLDGVGVGELPDADRYGDCGSSTLPNIARETGGIALPNLQKLGLGNIVPIEGVEAVGNPTAAYGKLREQSAGKDSTTGHWEIAGLITRTPFPVYPDGFPDEVIGEFINKTGCGGVLGNEPASGTEITERLGKRHVETGFPIVYTSADSVFQIAAHEQIIPIGRLYDWCTIARNKVLVDRHRVSRVIARPFTGPENAYVRTKNRRDFSVEPPRKTILDFLTDARIPTVTIGKVDTLFSGRGVSDVVRTKGNADGIRQLTEAIGTLEHGFVFANLVDFDQEYGHRNDVQGFARALAEFDEAVPGICGGLKAGDLLLLTSDHGNDPTTPSTDHSREYVPLIAYRPGMKEGRNIGVRETFADIAQTCAGWFSLPLHAREKMDGESFLGLLQ